MYLHHQQVMYLLIKMSYNKDHLHVLWCKLVMLIVQSKQQQNTKLQTFEEHQEYAMMTV